MLVNNLSQKGSKLIILIFMLITSLLLVSCDKANEKVDDATKVIEEAADKAGDAVSETADKLDDTTDKLVDKATDVVESAAKKVEEAVISNAFVGVWVGKLDSRLATLTITAQEGNDFEGKITVNYRNPLKQDVKGNFNPETKIVTMADQLHSRFKGKYNGKLSEDSKTYSGTFTTLADKNSYSFNLVKK